MEAMIPLLSPILYWSGHLINRCDKTVISFINSILGVPIIRLDGVVCLYTQGCCARNQS
jgi:hypothetical protein